MSVKLPRIFVAGDRGMVGSALVRHLRKIGGVDIVVRHRKEVDLSRQTDVEKFFRDEDIDQVYLAAGRVGGIYANNTFPAEFILENLLIECNVIHAAHRAGIQSLLFFGSSCIYPGVTDQPIREEALMTSALEPTNEPYAFSKIAGIKLCESYNRQYGRDYRSVMPTNLYGPNDNFHPKNSHAIPAMMRRFHHAVITGAEEVSIWGSGSPRREFLYVDDLAAASVHVMNLSESLYRQITREMLSHINIGTGVDCTIRELAEILARVTGFSGQLIFDHSQPDGAPRKLLDVSRLKALGWSSSTKLEEGLRSTYSWFLSNQGCFRG